MAAESRVLATVLIGLLVAAFSLVTATSAAAAPAITVSKSTGLNPDGEQVTVSGTGYDETKGIYVAVCVDNGPGQVPTPCLGGADTSGSAGGSVWISSNPPSYGAGLAQPYDPGGGFTVTLTVIARDPVTGTDCTQVACAVVTRADHTRTADRSQDARIPLSFATAPPPTSVAPTTTTTTTAPPTTAPPTTSTATTTTSSQPTPARTAVSTKDAGSDLVWWLAGGAVLLLIAGVVIYRLIARPPSPQDK